MFQKLSGIHLLNPGPGLSDSDSAVSFVLGVRLPSKFLMCVNMPMDDFRFYFVFVFIILQEGSELELSWSDILSTTY